MGDLIKLIEYLPKYDEIHEYSKDEEEFDYILRAAIEHIEENPICGDPTGPKAEDHEFAYTVVKMLTDKCWNRIHTGHFSEVPLHIRQIYALGSYFKIYFLLYRSVSQKQIEKCNEMFDAALLLGCTQDLYPRNDILLKEFTKFFNTVQGNDGTIEELPIIEPLVRQTNLSSDIEQIDCPSVEVFQTRYFEVGKPALLLNIIEHWPALKKWRNLNYILRIAGNRMVPIEIGSNYATDNWSQQLVKLRDFLRRQFSKDTEANMEIEYLAQHELFDQIPELKNDIRVPDYCTIGTDETSSVEIKAWLGPKGTISPMHYDPKHNILCQVFGTKQIILAEPEDSMYLYPHETKFLSNTSQIDAANIDLKQFPRADQARFYRLTLQEGDCLYLPPKWWHYVRSESPSFSVSFWWK